MERIVGLVFAGIRQKPCLNRSQGGFVHASSDGSRGDTGESLNIAIHFQSSLFDSQYHRGEHRGSARQPVGHRAFPQWCIGQSMFLGASPEELNKAATIDRT